jgi:hypothetical protein
MSVTDIAALTEREVWTAAGLLIQEHGEQAAIVAAQKADAFQKMGDMDGRGVWLRIMRATAAMIDVLQGMAN